MPHSHDGSFDEADTEVVNHFARVIFWRCLLGNLRVYTHRCCVHIFVIVCVNAINTRLCNVEQLPAMLELCEQSVQAIMHYLTWIYTYMHSCQYSRIVYTLVEWCVELQMYPRLLFIKKYCSGIKVNAKSGKPPHFWDYDMDDMTTENGERKGLSP